MSIEIALAAVAVSDLGEAKEFYTRLLGRPVDVEPMPTLAQWDFTPAGALQVVESPAHAGHCMATLLVSDLDATLDDLAAHGIEIGEVVTGVISRVTQVADPAGNVITLAEIPKD